MQTAVVARSEANGDGGDREYLTTFYSSEQLVLLNVSYELGNDEVAGARQKKFLDEPAAAANGRDHAVKKIKAFW